LPADVERVRRDARRLYSSRDVARALDRMAAAVAPRLEHANPVVLAVMHGGAFAAVELCKRFKFAHEFDYVHLTRYRGDTRGGSLEWKVRPRKELEGRTVLVVDDILDHGGTLRALDAELRRVGVAEHLNAVLVVKRLERTPLARTPLPRTPLARTAQPTLAAAGLAVDDVYVFGSGMDYRGYWRELGGIYAVAQP
jgi:hypoxanthine phosphoribosyltransferase